MLRKVLVVLCGVGLVLAVVGCGPSRTADVDTPITDSDISDEPIWVASPAQAFPEKAKDTIFGVGVAEAKAFPRLPLRMQAATMNSKRSVADQMRVFVRSVFEDYQEAVFTPSADTAEARGLTSSTMRTIVDETLLGCRTRSTWRDKKTNDYWVLSELSMDNLEAMLRQKMVKLEEKRLRVDAEQAHKRLDEIIEKNRKAVLSGQTSG